MDLKLKSIHAEPVARELTKLSIEHGYLPKRSTAQETAESIYELYNTLFKKLSVDNNSDD